MSYNTHIAHADEAVCVCFKGIRILEERVGKKTKDVLHVLGVTIRDPHWSQKKCLAKNASNNRLIARDSWLGSDRSWLRGYGRYI